MITIEERKSKHCAGITSLFITFDYNKEIVETIKQIQNMLFDKKTTEWESPLINLAELVNKLSLFDDVRIKLLKYSERKIEKNKLHKHKTTPYKYQEEGINYGLNTDKWLLLDVPGLGKTLQAILLAEELKTRDNIEHCLVICGINNLKHNWKKEITQHSKLDARILGERVNKNGRVVIDGVQERIKQLKSKIKEFFIITNIETLRDKKIIEALNKGPNKIDFIVFDECHVCKDIGSIQAKNLLKLKSCKYKLAMTGTLILNSPLDMYVPLKFIDMERCSQSTFKYTYCRFSGRFNDVFMGYKNLELLQHQLSQCSLRRTKDLLDLPPKTIVNEYVEMSPQQHDFYDALLNSDISMVDRVQMSTKSILGMVTRFRQATVLPSMLSSVCTQSAKIERCVELVNEILSQGDKVVIFSTFKEPVKELERRLNQHGFVKVTGDSTESECAEAQDAFMTDDNIKIIAGTLQKIGTGITLTKASYAIFLDVPWTDANYEQAQDRIYRIGTKKPVTIYHLITKDTIDERVLDIVSDKGAIASYMLDKEVPDSAIEKLRKYIENL